MDRNSLHRYTTNKQPLNIDSVYHPVSHNATIKDISSKSRCCNALAADIKVAGHNPAEVSPMRTSYWGARQLRHL